MSRSGQTKDMPLPEPLLRSPKLRRAISSNAFVNSKTNGTSCTGSWKNCPGRRRSHDIGPGSAPGNIFTVIQRPSRGEFPGGG